MGGQTSYNLSPDIAVPGQLGDLNLDSRVKAFVAGEPIPFGRLCEVDSAGVLWKVSGSGGSVTAANRNLAGISIFDVAREQQLASVGGSAGSGMYAQSEMVPVMRKGSVYAAWDGSTSGTVQTRYGAPNVNHISTTDTNGIRGVFSGGTNTGTAVGNEITAVPTSIVFVRDVSTLTPARGGAAANAYTFVCLLEVNLPGT